MPVPNLAKWYHLSETFKACPGFGPTARQVAVRMRAFGTLAAQPGG